MLRLGRAEGFEGRVGDFLQVVDVHGVQLLGQGVEVFSVPRGIAVVVVVVVSVVFVEGVTVLLDVSRKTAVLGRLYF